MFDRLFMPALTFTLLVAALAAFAADATQSRSPGPAVVRPERVVVTAARELPPSPLARAEASAATSIAR